MRCLVISSNNDDFILDVQPFITARYGIKALGTYSVFEKYIVYFMSYGVFNALQTDIQSTVSISGQGLQSKTHSVAGKAIIVRIFLKKKKM